MFTVQFGFCREQTPTKEQSPWLCGEVVVVKTLLQKQRFCSHCSRLFVANHSSFLPGAGLQGRMIIRPYIFSVKYCHYHYFFSFPADY
jgi:hypothetical protein